MPHRKVQRNLEILLLRQRGAKFTELAKMYGLSTEGVRFTVKKEGAKEAFGPYAYLLSGMGTSALRKFCKVKGQPPPQNLQELRGVLEEGWQKEIRSIRGVGPKLVEELEFILEQDIEFGTRGTGERDQRIYELRDDGFTFRQIGDMFGLPIRTLEEIQRRIHGEIYEEVFVDADGDSLSTLSRRAYSDICRMVNWAKLDEDDPGWIHKNIPRKEREERLKEPVTLAEFREWILDTPDWKAEFNYSGDKATVREIKTFVKNHR